MDFTNLIDEVPYGTNVEAVEVEPQIDDMDADGCIQKISNWERYRNFWMDYYTKKMDEVNAKCDRNIEFQNRKLREFFMTVPHRSTKTMEAYDLPSGKISISYSKQSMVPDKVAILKRFEEQGDDEFIKLKKELDWANYKTRLFISSNGEVLDKETGEVVSDVAVETSEPKFSVSINKKGGEDNGEGNPNT